MHTHTDTHTHGKILSDNLQIHTIYIMFLEGQGWCCSIIYYVAIINCHQLSPFPSRLKYQELPDGRPWNFTVVARWVQMISPRLQLPWSLHLLFLVEMSLWLLAVTLAQIYVPLRMNLNDSADPLCCEFLTLRSWLGLYCVTSPATQCITSVTSVKHL